MAFAIRSFAGRAFDVSIPIELYFENIEYSLFQEMLEYKQHHGKY